MSRPQRALGQLAASCPQRSACRPARAELCAFVHNECERPHGLREGEQHAATCMHHCSMALRSIPHTVVLTCMPTEISKFKFVDSDMQAAMINVSTDFRRASSQTIDEIKLAHRV